MSNLNEYILKLQKLTQTNLDILQSINDSFFTKQDHLMVNVGENQYAIPSFISLENKLNSLIFNFENLVHAPETGEAYLTFDGNSRSIQVMPYTHTPNPLVLNEVTNFNIKQNNLIKDFVTPTPYIRFDTQSLPNDITEVMVKKIIPIKTELKNFFKSNLVIDKNTVSSIKYNYKDLLKILALYKKDIDYIEYDSKQNMPIRKNIGYGTYVIEKIESDIIDENLDNFITVKLRNDMIDSIYMNELKYRLFDETIEKSIQPGDNLLTFEGNAQLEVVEVRHKTNTLVLKVLHGEFVNLVPAKSNDHKYIHNLNKLKYHSSIDFSEDKYVDVALEEDQYVFIAIAALNSRMNIQSSWGSGLIVDTYSLLNSDGQLLNEFYNENVKNIGDALVDMAAMMQTSILPYKDDYEIITKLKPVINVNDILVDKINKHLNDSTTIKNIKILYTQKKNYQSQLDTIREEKININTLLSETPLDDTTGVRNSYESRIKELTTQETNLLESLNEVINGISTEANNSEVSLENSKYHIRGFFNYDKFLNDLDLGHLIDHIKGIRIQYRYKNPNQEQGYAISINDNFVFSDWNNMDVFDREKNISKIDEYGYQYKLQINNDKINEPSFNQIDIPISQGEVVEMRLKLVFDYGSPFVVISSDWSDIVGISFPEEFLKDVQILDIISENNNEIKNNSVENLLKTKGFNEHIDDKLQDQNLTYYHKPEHIASGFYTSEKRIIPLRDKLEELNNDILSLKDEVFGTYSTDLNINFIHDGLTSQIVPYEDNRVFLASINDLLTSNSKYSGHYIISDDKKIISTLLHIEIENASGHMIKLFSMFPGPKDQSLNGLSLTKFNKNDYIYESRDNNTGVWIEYPDVDGDGGRNDKLQSCNQFLYFRTKNIFNNNPLYTSEEASEDGYKSNFVSGGTKMKVYPSLNKEYELCIDSSMLGSYIVLQPNKKLLIPLMCRISIPNKPNDGGNPILSKQISFDVMTSLYQDPTPYTITIASKYYSEVRDQMPQNMASSSNENYNSIT